MKGAMPIETIGQKIQERFTWLTIPDRSTKIFEAAGIPNLQATPDESTERPMRGHK